MSEFAASMHVQELNGSNGFQINGDVGSYSGFTVDSAGDVNGDGFTDIVINSNAPSGQVGAGYVVFGSAALPAAEIALSDLDGSNGFKIDRGVDPNAFGSARSAGDINGDGFDDLILSSPYASGLQLSGAGYVVFGKASGFDAELATSSLDGTNGFRIVGANDFERAGGAVGSAGDFNGDGVDDFLIGAGMSDGAAYLVFGDPVGFGAEFDLADLDGSNGFRIGPEASSLGFGRSVSSAGDINGDGLDDIVVGATDDHSNGNFSGSSYVLFGSAFPLAAEFELSNLDGSNGFQIIGAAEFDHSGGSVASAGDFNGDGLGDLIIGAANATTDTGQTGAAYILFGKAAGFSADLSLSGLDGENGFRMSGVAGFDSAGFSVASAGDVNGDGFSDVIIGAPRVSNGGVTIGSSYVVFGKSSGFDPELDLAGLDGANGFRIDGEGHSDQTGYSVAGAGDLNGDGFDDLLVGAPFADPNGDSGISYVIYGRAPDAAVNRIGSAADQTIRGGVFADTLSGLGGDDRLFGGYGWDTLAGGAGNDVLVGAHGYDMASFDRAANAVTVDLSLKIAQDTGEGMDRLVSIEALTGSSFDDVLTGNLGKNALYGGAGDDTLTGGTGGDNLFGGEGADTFIFLHSSLKNPSKIDKIRDLAAGDTIDLSDIDANPSTLEDDAFVLVSRFSGSAGEARIVYNALNDVSYLLLDVDGDRAADFRLRMDGDHREFEGFVW